MGRPCCGGLLGDGGGCHRRSIFLGIESRAHPISVVGRCKMIEVQDVGGGWMPIVGEKFQDVVRLLMWAMFLCGPDATSPSDRRDDQLHKAIGERIPRWSFVVHGFGFVGCGDTIQEADQAYIAAAGKRHRGRKGTEFSNPVQVWCHPVHGWRIEGWDGILGHVFQVRVTTGKRCGLCDIVDGVLDTIPGDQAPSGDLIDSTSETDPTATTSADLLDQAKQARSRQIDTYAAWMDEAGHRFG